ncbi:hypothetical protein DF121_31160 [Burkholderia stagnalis]|nr:hypothetical protein DF145_30965 [Burkholderia stagnalis]RQX89372.1 hypothetical protein DF121_31160 [Burkholderia stagnalis]RQY08722.1 hypothetical protein DF115_30815 [Burkholderia stagnalis]RQY24707.1 hypothetical protein DF114_30835 [Burkholderia stagnalis]
MTRPPARLTWVNGRGPVADTMKFDGQPQLLLRIGRGPHTPRSPRRPLDEVISPARPRACHAGLYADGGKT